MAGCGPSDGYRLGRVGGKVTFKGQPVTSGFIIFMPDRSKQTVGPQAMSKIADDGTYAMSTKVADDGAVVGDHQVGIMGTDPKPIVEVAEEDLRPRRSWPPRASRAEPSDREEGAGGRSRTAAAASIGSSPRQS